MDREMLIEAAYGEADLAEFNPDLDRGAPAAGLFPLDGAATVGLTAGLVAFGVLFWVLVLLLAAGWLAGLFLAALPWSFAAYLALAVVAAAAIGRHGWRAASPPAAPARGSPHLHHRMRCGAAAAAAHR